MTRTLVMNIEKLKMNKAIITLTRGGMELGLRLLKEYDDSVLYVNKRFDIKGERIRKINNGIMELTASIFGKYKHLIFIMATGIVVRAIAPHLNNKTKDPAVIVMDEKGRNVISLLSGHLGGANELALDIANKLNSNPVITTASDVNDTLAVDTLAMKLGYGIENYTDATKVTSHIVNGEKIGIISKNNLKIKLPDNFTILKDNKNLKKFKGIINITNEKKICKNRLDTVILRPRNIIIGIGCRRHKSKEEIIEAIMDSLNKINKSQLSIKHIATVDVKRNEKGIIAAADHLKVPLIIVDREQIRDVERNFETSDFVKSSIGVGAVAEPVAILSSNEGRLILKKTKYNGITIAIVEEGGA
ncbi:cobalt-precorrin 5A acetaldehyde-lyase [Paramaledivibacter caminithermalis DSM 15212]|uniref:Cobalt-precorrin 5A acetaldehyde-lyase n=2 Tax=Paramaledivibacter TaxID=1884934 RepID=A0A1M6ML86_PARC5|nr:cobalt-precorrin 5A acetaldehyde-lyase [Paramaledivibacter caminithermalis DSM 15212]